MTAAENHHSLVAILSSSRSTLPFEAADADAADVSALLLLLLLLLVVLVVLVVVVLLMLELHSFDVAVAKADVTILVTGQNAEYS